MILRDPGPFGQPSFYVFEREVWRGTPDADGSVGGGYAGAEAEVLTQGQLTQRLTATRLLAFGVFALAAPKKNGNQQLLLQVTAPGFMFTFESAAVERAQLQMLNQYSQIINNKARALPQPDVSGPAPSAADELAKFAELRDRGIITENEFTAKKTQLLA